MDIIIVKESFVGFEALSENAKVSASHIIRAVQAAPDMNKLKSVLPDDVVTTDGVEYHALVKDNYQHVAACIKISIDNKNRAVVAFQPYD
jgi:hypothetical protein